MHRPPTRTAPSRPPLAALVALAALTIVAQPTPALAAVTLVEGEKGKVHGRPVDLDDDFYRLSMVVTF
jgi:hypothetical protein